MGSRRDPPVSAAGGWSQLFSDYQVVDWLWVN